MSESGSITTDQTVVFERQRALRALLQHPLLTAAGSHAAEFGLVRRHAGWLREWLARNPGWSLQLDSELARLRKTPADLSDGTRPARDHTSDTTFSRRRYVVFCLALAALERADRQTTLGRLAEEIVGLASADPALAAAGITFELKSHDQRRDMVHAARALLALRVLARVHGTEQQFLAERGDVLYNVHRPALAGVLNVQRGPSTIDETSFERRLAAIVEEPAPDTDDGRNRRLRSRLTRRLLDDPVLYYNALDDDELAYLNSQRGQMLRQITDATGLIAEIRREGIAMVDDRGDMTDLGMPEEGTEGHLTLLLAEFLAAHLRRDSGTPVSHAALQRRTAQLITEHRAHWRKSVTEPAAEVALTEQTIDRLVALALAERTADGVVPLPAIARYALTSRSKGPQGSLTATSRRRPRRRPR